MDINIITPNNQSSQALKEAIEQIDTPYFILSTRPSKVTRDSNYIERVIKVAESYNADWVYSDYRKSINGQITNNPTIEYQKGSVRDDFDFGPIVLCKSKSIKR